MKREMENKTHVIFGAGPVGLALVDELVEREYQVRVVNRSGKAQVPTQVEQVAGDASDSDSTINAASGAAVVYQVLNPPYHRWPEEFPGLQESVVAAARVAGARYVSLENLYVYGDTHGQPIDETTPMEPHTRKGKVRLEMAETLATLSDSGDLELATARASNYFGPRATWQSPLGERVLGRVLAGKTAQVLGDPDTKHSFTYLKDLSRVLATLGTDDRALGEVWHVPNAPAQTTNEVIAMIGDELGQEIKVSAAPEPILKLMGLFNPTLREVNEMLYEFKSNFVADGEKFSKLFGMKATPLDQAIAQTVAWWKSR
jgi:nucleoside-diphosphate-sugar epimerase